MYNTHLLKILLKKKKNQLLKQTFSFFDATEKFKWLLSIRAQVDSNAYAMYVRMAIQTDTNGVPLELLFDVLDGLDKKDLMSRAELNKWKKLPDVLTIYRGTDASEFPPRISWSLIESKARVFEHGQMYKAIINKNDIYAYFSENCDEEEIIAHVIDNFDNIFDNT